MPKSIAMTGASGIIGRVLCAGISDVKIKRLSRPWFDMRDYGSVRRALTNQEMVVHLAWDSKADNTKTAGCSAHNTAMFLNLYKAAAEKKVKRLVMASSVHADDFYGFDGPGLLSADRNGSPATTYGVHKVFMESIGRLYSQMGIEVICVRFGGVTPDNIAYGRHERERSVYLHHQDCVDLIVAILNCQQVPNRYCVVNAVSDTPYRIHDLANPFGWTPPFRQSVDFHLLP